MLLMTEGLDFTPRQERIAELYYVSNSVNFKDGPFKFSVHQDNPNLPLSPNKLHYPDDGKPGSEYLPELFSLVGDELFEICEAQDPPIRPRRVAGLPKGALPLADELAKHYDEYPENLLEFRKVVKDGFTIFLPPETAEYEEGDETAQVDDHTSAGRNAKLFRHALKRAGLNVPDLLSVVDREQGGVANIAADGARLLAIFTVSQLLDYGVVAEHINQEQSDEAKAYNVANQFKIGYHVIPIDNTVTLLEKMRNDPLAVASCDMDFDGCAADVIYATPEGTRYNPDSRIAAYCGQHIIKGEGWEGCIPLFDQSNGYWTRREGLEPLFRARDDLDHYEETLAKVFA